MGNANGKGGAAMFDGGYLEPTGVYPKENDDFDVKVVTKLIMERKLAPFYKGADDIEEIDREDIEKVIRGMRQDIGTGVVENKADRDIKRVDTMEGTEGGDGKTRRRGKPELAENPREKADEEAKEVFANNNHAKNTSRDQEDGVCPFCVSEVLTITYKPVPVMMDTKKQSKNLLTSRLSKAKMHLRTKSYNVEPEHKKKVTCELEREKTSTRITRREIVLNALHRVNENSLYARIRVSNNSSDNVSLTGNNSSGRDRAQTIDHASTGVTESLENQQQQQQQDMQTQNTNNTSTTTTSNNNTPLDPTAQNEHNQETAAFLRPIHKLSSSRSLYSSQEQSSSSSLGRGATVGLSTASSTHLPNPTISSSDNARELSSSLICSLAPKNRMSSVFPSQSILYTPAF
ncbi:Protein SIP5 [Zancudomyces culisetae]|uniref:Protein SIP5 n=1 Tax=Zancudomyces culisetae TaxID=1213189 RepID=A0A1R1PKN8_ZANCU|nr:Protein SIP5 [Zancudomyces culisetae]|eukprot:OMH81541.1 Protein SIP5 [Zancudomyces culisetae]